MSRAVIFALALVFALSTGGAVWGRGQEQEVPPLLKPWEEWAVWGEDHRACPREFGIDGIDGIEEAARAHPQHLCVWPSRLQLQAGGDGGAFQFRVALFTPGYVALPGSGKQWPQEVRQAGQSEASFLPVLSQKGRPVVFLPAGEHEIAGRFLWSALPDFVQLPRATGLLSLTLHGEQVSAPSWDESGILWLQRQSEEGEAAAKNFFSHRTYALLEDGEPLWLNLRVELVVSGKNREEVLGQVVPAGWRLTAVESLLPVAVDAEGRLKVQVRTGKWSIALRAARLTSPEEVAFGSDPISDEIFLAFKAAPELRSIDLEGMASIDASQIDFPAEWRSLPVYRWEAQAPFRIVERLRGMGGQRPPGLELKRQLWLDSRSGGFTFLDNLTGKAQEIWRLDTLPGQKLGAVRHRGEGKLITLNPETGAAGVELRERNVQLQAVGQIDATRSIAATGWDADVEKASVVVNLPPGWRLFSLSGADYVRGDWLTAWSLIDLFLVLLFSFAVLRLWGMPLALLAFWTLLLSYHEPQSPVTLWLLLLIPLGLQRVVPATGWGQRLVAGAKWVLLAALVSSLFPFIVGQIRSGLYPQLEKHGGRGFVTDATSTAEEEVTSEAHDSVATEWSSAAAPAKAYLHDYQSSAGISKKPERGRAALSLSPTPRLDIDPEARVQTGPAVPQWQWRKVQYGWSGPVSRTQEVRFHFIPPWVERGLMFLRVLLPIALLGLLIKTSGRLRRSAAVLLLSLGFAGAGAGAASAESFPDEALLNTLKERLLAAPPEAAARAEIASAHLSIDAARQLRIEVEVHTGVFSAVPLPPRFTGWEAHAVTVDGTPQAALQRRDGSLWIALPAGVHRVEIKGALHQGLGDWECSFPLKPRHVTVDAPGWKVSGLTPDGVPEEQLFLTREQQATPEAGSAATSAEYDRVETTSIVRVERELDLGLIWQVQTRIVRLTPPGKAIALRIPLLPGENILTSDIPVHAGYAEVRLGGQQESVQWASELSREGEGTIHLTTRSDDAWVERWSLRAAPLWNVRSSGLAPIFTPGQADLLPVWHPWPGESATLVVQRPKTQEGATLTIQSSKRTIKLGQRQRVSKLVLEIECSRGEDFSLALPEAAEVLSLQLDGQAMPIRQGNGKLVVALSAGKHSLAIEFREEERLTPHTSASAISLPVEGANASTIIEVPQSRWVLFTYGPLIGPAVLFWGVLLAALVAGVALSRVRGTPLKVYEWVLLSIGLVQSISVSPLLPLFIVAWLLLLVWRGSEKAHQLPTWSFNLFQLLLIGLTVGSVILFIVIAFQGLLGTPSMMIEGNRSSAYDLKWYEALPGSTLPQPGVVTISLWWYRLFMLLWALWLASALVRWLGWGWNQFSRGGIFRWNKAKG